ncbi:dTDP-4-dehydrorhamnose reductase [Rhizobium giardinii]|uniref:dTDP-4-dehydrorhamnose reductase n=1 Tax=Rhizobium giardinii TaxID=56731 RepID=UPI00058B796F|nr:dTDP-4-dehydrorhamnose reductase [Rhizobium giardinii]
MGKRILVTGREGQVVRAIIERAQAYPDIEIVAIGRPKLDLGHPETIESAVSALEPDLIVSAAAFTAVDQAESEETLATIINGEAAGVLAYTASRLDIPIIHLSTDYVFDGQKSDAYTEKDHVAPLGAYGRSKLAGERAVAFATENHTILRTAWVHSPFGKNFLKTMLRLAGDRDTINVVADQYGTPTSALDIADAILKVASNLFHSDNDAMRGIFHLTNSGKASWADFAETIFDVSERAGGPCAKVHRISSADYPTPAKRPANSVLDCHKLAITHGVHMQDWRTAAECVVKYVLNRQNVKKECGE